MDRGGRDKGLDAVKGFTILLVMLGHCIVLNHMEDGYIYDAIKAVQMPLFMLVSGFLSARTLRAGSGRELLRKLGKRAVNYLVPFVSWIFITNVTDFFVVFRSILFELDRGLWFLMTLFILTAVLYAAVYMRDFTRAGLWGFFLVYAAAGGLLAAQLLNGSTFLSPHLTVNYLPFHLLGYLMGRYGPPVWTTWKGNSRKTALTVTVAAAGAVFLFLVARFDMIVAADRAHWLIQMLASLLGSLVCFCIVYHIPAGRIQGFLSHIGLYTLEIYVLHFRFATLLGFDGEGLKLYSVRGIFAVISTFALMGVLTAFFIYTLKKLRITDFLLFGK